MLVPLVILPLVSPVSPFTHQLLRYQVLPWEGFALSLLQAQSCENYHSLTGFEGRSPPAVQRFGKRSPFWSRQSSTSHLPV